MSMRNDEKRSAIAFRVFDEWFKVHWLYDYNERIYGIVSSIFKILKPLSRSKVLTPITMTIRGQEERLIVGQWLESTPNKDDINLEKCVIHRLNESEFFRAVTRYGEQLSSYVRPRIKDAFVKLVELARSIKFPHHKVFTVELSEPTQAILKLKDDKVEKERFLLGEISRVTVDTDIPKVTIYIRGINEDEPREITFYLSNILHVNKDVFNALMECFSQASEEYNRYWAKINEVITEMKKIVIPYEVAKKLK